MKMVIALGLPSVAPPAGGPRLSTIVSVPSARPSLPTTVTSKLCEVTPAANVRLPEAGLKSSSSVAVPPVTDQSTVTPPVRLLPARATVTLTTPPSTTLAAAVANFTTPAESPSVIESVAVLRAPMETPTAGVSWRPTVFAPVAAGLSPVATVNVRDVTFGPKVSMPAAVV